MAIVVVVTTLLIIAALPPVRANFAKTNFSKIGSLFITSEPPVHVVSKNRNDVSNINRLPELILPQSFNYLPKPEVGLSDTNYDKDTIEQAAIKPVVVNFAQDYRIVEAHAYRQRIVTEMVSRARNLGLNPKTLQNSIEVALTAVNRPALPSYAEHVSSNGKNLWVIVVNWESGKRDVPLSRIAVFAIDAASIRVVESWPQTPLTLENYAQGENPHKTLFCKDCHPNFDSADRAFKSADWKETAKAACTRCHEHKKQFAVYAKSIHGKLAIAGKLGKNNRPAPTCADCHSGHTTLALKKDPRKRAVLRAQAMHMCGNCHRDYWDSYNDYYHGRAYKTGAPDAPACWDCHGYHSALPLDNLRSNVAKANLPYTCKKCHRGSDLNFSEFGKLVHGYEKELQSNPVLHYLNKTLGLFSEETAPGTSKPASSILHDIEDEKQ